MDLNSAIHDLKAQGYFVWDHFLTADEVASTVIDYQKIYEAGSFERAGTGNQTGPRALNAEIRADETHWLDPAHLTATQNVFWSRLDDLKQELNQAIFLGLWSMDGHYSRYPVGGHYQQHLDRFQNDDLRKLSVVLYFNSAWKSGDGGELRVRSTLDGQMINLAPLAGRLICFLSGSVLHEVLGTHQVRKSFAGWWKIRPLVRG